MAKLKQIVIIIIAKSINKQHQLLEVCWYNECWWIGNISGKPQTADDFNTVNVFTAVPVEHTCDKLSLFIYEEFILTVDNYIFYVNYILYRHIN